MTVTLGKNGPPVTNVNQLNYNYSNYETGLQTGPFNFPLEIAALQLLGALFMGNKVLLKVDSRVSAVIEQFLRLLIHAGLPATDIDLIHCQVVDTHHGGFVQ